MKKLLRCLNPDINVGRLEEPLQAVLRSNGTVAILLLLGVMFLLLQEVGCGCGAFVLAALFVIARTMPQQPIRPTGRKSESGIGLLQLLAILAAAALLIIGAWSGIKWVIGRFDALFGVVRAKDEQVQQLDPHDTNTTSSVRRYYYSPGIVVSGSVIQTEIEHPIQMTTAGQTAANKLIGQPETSMPIQTDVWEYGCENTNVSRKISTAQIRQGPFPGSILLTTTRPAPPEGAVIWYGSPTPDGTNWVVVGGSLPFQTRGTNSVLSSMALLIDVPRAGPGSWFYKALWDTNNVTAE